MFLANNLSLETTMAFSSFPDAITDKHMTTATNIENPPISEGEYILAITNKKIACVNKLIAFPKNKIIECFFKSTNWDIFHLNLLSYFQFFSTWAIIPLKGFIEQEIKGNKT